MFLLILIDTNEQPKLKKIYIYRGRGRSFGRMVMKDWGRSSHP